MKELSSLKYPKDPNSIEHTPRKTTALVFYKDRCEYESNGETQTINYNIIKSVRMGDLNEVSIMTVDRGVEETHGIFLVNETSLSAKDVCKKIHELVFR